MESNQTPLVVPPVITDDQVLINKDVYESFKDLAGLVNDFLGETHSPV